MDQKASKKPTGGILKRTVNVKDGPDAKKKRVTKPKGVVTFAEDSFKSSESSQSDTSETYYDTLIESAGFVSPTEQTTAPTQKSQVMELIRKHKVRNLLQWRALARTKDHPIRAMSEKLVMRKNYEDLINDCCKAAIFLEEVFPFKKRLYNIPGPSTSGLTQEDYVQVAEFSANFDKILEINHLNPQKVFKSMFAVLSRNSDHESKVRTIYFHGPASCGKSSLMLLMSSVYEEHEIGKFSPIGQNSQFWLDDLYGKEIYIGDEARATELNIQAYLLLLEGNRDMKTEVKYGGKPCLEPKPVMLACNAHIFSACQAYARAVLDRVYLVELTVRTPDNCNVRPEKRLYPYILRTLYQRHVKGLNQF